MARAKLRKPFVVTLTGAAAAFACSSEVVSNPPSTTAQPVDGGMTTNPPGVVDCPTVKPNEGSSCPENGVSCTYAAAGDAACGDPDTTGTIACEVGIWTAKSALPTCDAGDDASTDASDAADGD